MEIKIKTTGRYQHILTGMSEMREMRNIKFGTDGRRVSCAYLANSGLQRLPRRPLGWPVSLTFVYQMLLGGSESWGS